MKRIHFMVLAVAAALGYALPAVCQQPLPEVIVTAANYKYLKNVGGKEVAIPAQRLERAAAAYDIKSSEFYEEDYETYFISFSLPEGEILAAYDKNGKLLRTAEKYKDLVLPATVSKAIVTRFPNWGISKDVYLVKYFDNNGGSAVKKYKVVLQNGTKRLRVQVDEQGQFS
ncbi:MAG TPA: hypothetical protein VN616_08790 [Puia sp.]|nr:hypothetical protein [Puia sp.]